MIKTSFTKKKNYNPDKVEFKKLVAQAWKKFNQNKDNDCLYENIKIVDLIKFVKTSIGEIISKE